MAIINKYIFTWPNLSFLHPIPIIMGRPDTTHCRTPVIWLQWSAGCFVTPPNTWTSRLVQGMMLPSIPVLQWARAESSAWVRSRSQMLNWESSPSRERDASKRSPPIEDYSKEKVVMLTFYHSFSLFMFYFYLNYI